MVTYSRMLLLFQGQLYIGVLVMAAFVLFDTQNIVEKVRAGSTDVVQHSMDLFFDVLSLFRRLLIILTQKVRLRKIYLIQLMLRNNTIVAACFFKNNIQERY